MQVIERLAGRRVAAWRARVAARVPADVSVSESEEGVVLSGPRLRFRWVTDARFRGFWR
ncbi:hypothetical protein [Sphingomonas sp. ID0503]|uniref:hypothetical protein n=1 Tax=Sphingomonas sp. ID0503 TaxID=3399691 RepID=UPI003AFB43C8